MTNIGYSAFYNCCSLKTIELPVGLKTIEEQAFFYCSDLSNIVIPGTVKKISDNAFSYCTDLSQVEILEGVEEIGAYAFYHCRNLSLIKISEGIKKIGEYAFYYCEELTSIEMPDTLISIDDKAFCCCFSLMAIAIPESVTFIGYDVFSCCDDLTIYGYVDSMAETYAKEQDISFIELRCGDSLVWSYDSITKTLTISGTGAMEDYEYAFDVADDYYEVPWIDYVYSRQIETVIVEEGVTSIGTYAFYGLGSLTTVELPSTLTCIGLSAFEECNNLKIIEIPQGLKTIGSYAFFWCNNLVAIEIPNSVSNIGESAFWGCDNLTIFGYAGSFAKTYAKNNGIPFVELGTAGFMPFVDVAKTDGNYAWFGKSIKAMYDQGVMSGYDTTHFAPYANITRADFALTLYRIAGKPAISSANIFTDVSAGAYYADAVIWANEVGVVKGVGNGTFKPDADGGLAPQKSITRAEIAVILDRYNSNAETTD